MILYHYTRLINLGSADGSKSEIMRDGLLPSRWDGYPHDDVSILETVWLTAQAEGIPRWWLDQNPELLKACCRIRVAIPMDDKRLMSMRQFVRLLGANPYMIEWHNDSWRQSWVYCGKVSLSWFRAVEYADPEMRATAQAELRPSGTE